MLHTLISQPLDNLPYNAEYLKQNNSEKLRVMAASIKYLFFFMGNSIFDCVDGQEWYWIYLGSHPCCTTSR